MSERDGLDTPLVPRGYSTSVGDSTGVGGDSTSVGGDSTSVGDSTGVVGDSTSVAATYCLHLGDDALIYAQRLGEWIARAPQIEEDMALGNIALDLLGQARALLTRSGELDGTSRSEDDLAYFRDEREFRNVQLVEQPAALEQVGGSRGRSPRGFGFEMARLLTFATYQVHLYAALADSADEAITGVARKALKEVTYHRDHARQWVLRLGDGTEKSHRRVQDGLVAVSPYVAELFDDDAVSVAAAEAGIGVRPSTLHDAFGTDVSAVLDEATLALPEPPRWRSRGGRDGLHSQAMGYLLAEMQHIARSHPGATW